MVLVKNIGVEPDDQLCLALCMVQWIYGETGGSERGGEQPSEQPETKEVAISLSQEKTKDLLQPLTSVFSSKLEVSDATSCQSLCVQE